MAARVSVVVETSSVGGGVLRAITSEMGALGRLTEELTGKNRNWGNIAQQATSLVINGLKDAMKATQAYTAEVRDMMEITGTTAEESSKMVQVLDDFEISVSTVATAVRAMTKQGLNPTVDTIAKLSDSFNALGTQQEKNAFLFKNFGRSGIEWVNILKRGGEEITRLNEASEGNLILTQQNIDSAEEYRLALDSWNDAVLGLKVSIGNELIPTLTTMMKGISNTNLIRDEANRLIVEGVAHNREEALTMAAATVARQQSTVAIGENKDALDDNTLSAEAQAEAIKKISEANTGLLSLTTSLQSETDRYKNTAAELHEQQDLLRADYVEGTVNAEEYKAKMGELTGAVKENQKAHEEAGKKIAFSLLQQKVAMDGLSDAEFDALLGMGVEWGIYDQVVANSARTMDEQMGAIATSMTDPISKLTQMNEKVKAAQNLAGHTWTYYFDIQVSGKVPNLPGTGSGYTSGNSVANQMQERTQSGGTVYAGRPTMVGEAGAEPFFPASNGRILGHAESLHALTVGGGGGNTNYFYGPVTLELGADAAGGLMSIRM